MPVTVDVVCCSDRSQGTGAVGYKMFKAGAEPNGDNFLKYGRQTASEAGRFASEFVVGTVRFVVFGGRVFGYGDAHSHPYNVAFRRNKSNESKRLPKKASWNRPLRRGHVRKARHGTASSFVSKVLSRSFCEVV